MSMAWRARDPLERIAYARKALKANEKCCNVTFSVVWYCSLYSLPAAWVLLAEEEATTIAEVSCLHDIIKYHIRQIL